MITQGEQSVQNWMCGHCNDLHDWFTSNTACCGARSVRAHSDVRCPLCLDDLPGWNLYDDGITRRCPCAFGMTGSLPAQPNPSMREATSAYVLSLALKPWLSCVPVIVPRRRAAAQETSHGTEKA